LLFLRRTGPCICILASQAKSKLSELGHVQLHTDFEVNEIFGTSLRCFPSRSLVDLQCVLAAFQFKSQARESVEVVAG
jgi:sorbitol-specific phosphotransferase system component IIA